MTTVHIQIRSNYFTVGVEARDGVIVFVAPILAKHEMVGMNGKQFVDYCRQKGWTYEVLPKEDK